MELNPLHPAPGPAGRHCGDCVWRFVGGRGSAVDRCRRHGEQRVQVDWPACAAHTEALDCNTCAACCREAYHVVEVAPRDPFVKCHAEHVVREEGRLVLPRPSGNCVCLEQAGNAYRCIVYEQRPRSCADFEIAGPNCVDARVRLGITP